MEMNTQKHVPDMLVRYGFAFRRQFALMAFFLVVSAWAAEPILDIASDGKANVTPAFQQAIDRVASNGGGRLVVPPGEYVVSGLEL